MNRNWDSSNESVHSIDWKMESLLRKLRESRFEIRKENDQILNPAVLPSKPVLTRVVNNLLSALFTDRLGLPNATSKRVDSLVEDIVESMLNVLVNQVELEVRFNHSAMESHDRYLNQAIEIVRTFADQLPDIRRTIEEDILTAYDLDPSSRNIDEILLSYPPVVALAFYRFANALYASGAHLAARMISDVAQSKTHIEIDPSRSTRRDEIIRRFHAPVEISERGKVRSTPVRRKRNPIVS